ncbi:MAG: hypothetical protein JNL94_17475 [Planctomycetes bacterium]|nr:hypothetical protein [Planctomycetota bacterium]
MHPGPLLTTLLLGLIAASSTTDDPPRPSAQAPQAPSTPPTPQAPRAPQVPDAKAPPRLIGPRSGKDKDAAARRFGADASVEKAVLGGLDWLARHQDESGLFDPDGFPMRCADGGACDGIGKGQHGEDMPCPFDAALSAMATLAFLGHGHVPGAASDAYGGVVERALLALRGHDGDRFALAIATQAFAEAEVLEGKGRWQDDVERGVAGLLELRQTDGAFGYAAPWRPGSDVPYSALVVEALMTARDAGATLPEDLGKGVDAFLDSLELKKGRLAYLLDGRSYGYTPTTTNGHLAAAMRELLDVDRSGERHRAHLALVASSAPKWAIEFEEIDVPGQGKVTAQIGELSLYQWYYGNLASFLAGPDKFRNYYTATKRELLAHQRKDGCAKGSWNPEGTYERQTGGRVMATALAVLMLEQPYRHRRRD